ncbi:MAG: peptidylprolyl isomerase [Steroidobacteraceae bacterium]
MARDPATHWRRPDPDNTLYLQLSSGRVIIELAPRVAPHHVANIKALVRAHYFDGLGILRVQDETSCSGPILTRTGRCRSQ